MPKMKAAIFAEPGRIVLESRLIPDVGPLDALVRVSTTTICGTDVHILRGEYPVRKGLIVGHEPVGIIEKLGSQVVGYREGQRVIAGAITPSGHSYACLCGQHSQDGGAEAHGFKPAGGWRFGNTIDGCQAEFVLVPDAMVNLSPVPANSDGRAGADVPRHHVDGICRCRERRCASRRHRRGVRSGSDWTLRGDRGAPHGGYHRDRC